MDMVVNQMVVLDHVITLKNCISNFTKLVATKLGKVPTSGKRFRIKTLKPPTTSYFFSFLPSAVFK